MSFTAPKDQKRPTLDTGPGLTKQSMRDECNINNIMAKYQKTGLVDFVSNREAQYMETDPIDFHEAMNIVTSAKEMFADIPSSIRKKFNNDPGEFLEFVQNPENIDQVYELGLAQRPPDYVPPQVETASPEAKTPDVEDTAPAV